MDKSAIKNFATTARRLLNDQVKDKAALYGITDKEIKPIELIGDGFRIGGNVYDATTLSQYRHLVKEIKDKGFNNVIEEVAYTWFNRFIAQLGLFVIWFKTRWVDYGRSLIPIVY